MSLISNPVLLAKYYYYDDNATLVYMFRFSDETFIFTYNSHLKDLVKYDEIVKQVGYPQPESATSVWNVTSVWEPWAQQAIKESINGLISPFWENDLIYFNAEVIPDPINNDNRETCFWCQTKTKEVIGFSYKTIYHICPKCKK